MVLTKRSAASRDENEEHLFTVRKLFPSKGADYQHFIGYLAFPYLYPDVVMNEYDEA